MHNCCGGSWRAIPYIGSGNYTTIDRYIWTCGGRLIDKIDRYIVSGLCVAACLLSLRFFFLATCCILLLHTINNIQSAEKKKKKKIQVFYLVPK